MKVNDGVVAMRSWSLFLLTTTKKEKKTFTLLIHSPFYFDKYRFVLYLNVLGKKLLTPYFEIYIRSLLASIGDQLKKRNDK